MELLWLMLLLRIEFGLYVSLCEIMLVDLSTNVAA